MKKNTHPFVEFKKKLRIGDLNPYQWFYKPCIGLNDYGDQESLGMAPRDMNDTLIK